MINSYFELSSSEQREIIQTAAAELGKRAAVLEKDIWVCWVLDKLFSIPNAHPMAFKGGTSLSKVYNVIDRFSEDVDITLDYRYFEDNFDPFAEGVSKTKIKKFSDRLKSYVKNYAMSVVLPHLRKQLEKLSVSSDETINIDKSGEKIWVSFPSVIEDSDEYLKSQVLIELGGRNVIDPNERHMISPYVAELVPSLEFTNCEVIVLSPERTFWEKATLIHVECNRNQVKANADRLSRHWYDLVMLSKHCSGLAAINNRLLFEDVLKQKKAFFNASYANYDECLEGRLNLLPSNETIFELQKDYEQMVSAGMMSAEAPHFSEIVEAIQQIESDVNTW